MLKHRLQLSIGIYFNLLPSDYKSKLTCLKTCLSESMFFIGWFLKHSEPRNATLEVGLIFMFSLSPCPNMPTVKLTYKSLVSSWVNFVWLTTSTKLTNEPPYDAEMTNPSHNTNNTIIANVLFGLNAAIVAIVRSGSDGRNGPIRNLGEKNLKTKNNNRPKNNRRCTT